MIILQKQNVERIVTSEDEAAKLEAAGFKRLSEQFQKAVAQEPTPPATNKEPPKAPANAKDAKGGKGSKGNAATPKGDATTNSPPASLTPENGGGADGAESTGADNKGCAGQSETTG